MFCQGLKENWESFFVKTTNAIGFLLETLAAPGGHSVPSPKLLPAKPWLSLCIPKSIQKERPSRCSSVEVPWAYESVRSVGGTSQ